MPRLRHLFVNKEICIGQYYILFDIIKYRCLMYSLSTICMEILYSMNKVALKIKCTKVHKYLYLFPLTCDKNYLHVCKQTYFYMNHPIIFNIEAHHSLVDVKHI